MRIIENLEDLITRKKEIVKENVKLRDNDYWGKENKDEAEEEYKERARGRQNTIIENNHDISALERVIEILKSESNLEISLVNSVEVNNNPFPFRVYKNQMKQFDGGIFPINEAVGAFSTREYAEDFVDYQATIDRETKYSVKKVEPNMQKKQNAAKSLQHQSPKL